MQPQNIQDFHNFISGNSMTLMTSTPHMSNFSFPSSSNFNDFETNNNNHSFSNHNFASFYSNSHHQEFQEISDSSPEARAILALKNHKEAEKRRRERINSHLDRLRTLLPCNSKTDKATLLAKVVQRVRDLKEQTSQILQLENYPSENDEITVFSSDDYSNDGRLLIKASLCCEDRSDLIPDLIETMKNLGLSPLRAEMITIGGRIRNVIILAGDQDNQSIDEYVVCLRNALKSLIQRPSHGSGERSKRRRLVDGNHDILC
ncbi:hypothetical protein Leryth_009121 [Lithospermum erythrorhizon]|nr:hypothetical protein Leryth_009121 [Lithospermum erythrorhizon]